MWPLRSASRAKSIIMIAFFLTMPISKIMPMIETMLRSCPLTISRNKAPTPADGKVVRMVTGWMKLS